MVEVAVFFVVVVWWCTGFSAGAGPSLITVVFTALWAGPVIFPSFIFLTAIAGGVVGLAILLLRRRRMSPAAANGTPSPAPAVMPYGVAIAIGGLMVALTLVKGTIL